MAKSQEKIRSLWPLPGGNDQYLFTLVQALQWLAQKDDETRDEELNAWFQKEYHVGENTAPGYIEVIKRLDAIQVDEKGRVEVTDFGMQIVIAENLRQQADLVVDCYMQNFLAFPEVLHVYNEIEGSIHVDNMVEKLMPAFPRWTSVAQYEYRALWLLSLGCLEQDHGRYYQITEYGRNIAEQYPATIPEASVAKVQEIEKTKKEYRVEKSALEELVIELEESARDSKNSERFEVAIAEAFLFLGFQVDQLGDSGDTDVLLHAEIGNQSYRVVVDGKSRSGGKLTDFDPIKLKEHREKNKADYITVVAEDFAGGSVSRKAEDFDIVLLSVEVLSKWLRLHQETPFNLNQHRSMFEKTGRIDSVAVELKRENTQRKRWASLLFDLSQLLEGVYAANLRDPLSTDNLFKMLVTRLEGVQYSEDMVEEAVQLLRHPALGQVLIESNEGVSLQMNLENTVAALHAFANLVHGLLETED
jgi:hypothetical protein